MRWALLIGCLAGALGCKPADEPPRRPLAPMVPTAQGKDLGSPPAPAGTRTSDAPPTVAEVTRPAPEVHVVDERTPDVIDDATPELAGEDAADHDAATDTQPAALDDGAAQDSATAVVEAPDTLAPEVAPGRDARLEAVVATLARAASSAEQDKARALNKSGLEKHKQKAYEQAAADYRAALEAWPAHPFSRYNLACALALLGKGEDALFELEVLGRMAETTSAARDRLRAARVDSDFTTLRAGARFRELTGATDILIAWTRDEDKALAKRLAELLRNARWGGKAAARAWNAIEGLPTRAAVLYRGDDAVARKVVEEVAGALATELPDISAEPAGALPPEAPPIVVWLPPPGTPPPDPAPDAPAPAPDAPTPDAPTPDAPPPDGPRPDDGALDAPKDFVGLTLVGPGPGRETLELKPTGFFVWQVTPAVGQRGQTTSRTGRWRLRGGTLVLSYKETISTPAKGEPHVEVREAQSASLAVAVTRPGTIAIEGRTFRPER